MNLSPSYSSCDVLSDASWDVFSVTSCDVLCVKSCNALCVTSCDVFCDASCNVLCDASCDVTATVTLFLSFEFCSDSSALKVIVFGSSRASEFKSFAVWVDRVTLKLRDRGRSTRFKVWQLQVGWRFGCSSLGGSCFNKPKFFLNNLIKGSELNKKKMEKRQVELV